jgi:mRNA interferase MazF
MTKYSVVLVPFPFDDLSSTKVRPAVCLTDPIGSHGHIILAFITSRIPASPLNTDLVIDASHPDFAQTGLRVSSTLQLHRLMTITQTLPRRELGALSPALQTQISDRLRILFDLKPPGERQPLPELSE